MFDRETAPVFPGQNLRKAIDYYIRKKEEYDET
jgi:hypothetical protein